MDVEPEILVEGLANGKCKTGADVLKHVPHCSPVSKNALIDTCGKNYIGKNKAREMIDTLVADGTLYELHRSRKGCRPETFLARSPRPENLSDDEFFTAFMVPVKNPQHPPPAAFVSASINN